MIVLGSQTIVDLHDSGGSTSLDMRIMSRPILTFLGTFLKEKPYNFVPVWS